MMVVLYAPVTHAERTPRKCDCRIARPGTQASFDDPNLVSHGGLVPVMALAERAGLPDLLEEHVRPAASAGSTRT
jgi:hypothetical protein